MPATFDTISVTLPATVGLGGSFAVAYPPHRTAKDYMGATGHILSATAYPTLFASQGNFSISFGASNMTVTLNIATSAYVAGTRVTLQVDRADVDWDEPMSLANPNTMMLLTPVKITLGAPIAASATAIAASQGVTGGANGLVNGGQAVAGVATLASPRNVVAAWTSTSVLTVNGFDEYGAPMREVSASGTSFTGAKAFSRITSFSFSATVTGATVGTGVVLGLPVYLADAVDVVREILNGAAATAGTIAAGVVTQTATSGDVRGTYNPSSAPDGARVYELIAMLRSPSARGSAQFSG